MTPSPPLRGLTRRLALLFAGLFLAACTSSAPPTGDVRTSGAADRTPGSSTPAGTPAMFDQSLVHEVSISFDQTAYEAMIETYASSRKKEWIEATVTIDGTPYQRAGIRLKGNSSLARLAEVGRDGTDEASPKPSAHSLPWLVDLDRFVAGQSHGGVLEFVIRSNDSATALNEAVALELLQRAGLASQEAIAVRFRANDGEPVLRLVIEHPDDVWMARSFSTSGALYKAESSGDYSYRGDDPDAYDEVFDQEAGEENADLTPLIEFLKFINGADDETFAAEIGKRLDVDAFATYLAMQELLDNFDDIDGPGNNSYLYYDAASGRFTLVPWDYNLALGAGGDLDRAPGGSGDGNVILPWPGASFDPGAPGASLEPPPPGASFAPDGGPAFEGPAPGGGVVVGHARPNVLSERFLEVDHYKALVDDRKAEMTTQLLDSGTAAAILAEWVALLHSQASDLVTAETVATEARRVASHF